MGLTEEENFITKLNYSERIKGAAGTVAFLACGIAWLAATDGMDTTTAQEALRAVVLDVFIGAAGSGLGRLLIGNHRKTNFLIGTGLPSIYETAEAFGAPGFFDWSDYVAYAAGAAVYSTLEWPARKLYESGFTQPIYRALRIQDQRSDFSRD